MTLLGGVLPVGPATIDERLVIRTGSGDFPPFPKEGPWTLLPSAQARVNVFSRAGEPIPPLDLRQMTPGLWELHGRLRNMTPTQRLQYEAQEWLNTHYYERLPPDGKHWVDEAANNNEDARRLGVPPESLRQALAQRWLIDNPIHLVPPEARAEVEQRIAEATAGHLSQNAALQEQRYQIRLWLEARGWCPRWL
jgi:hypothetical protein